MSFSYNDWVARISATWSKHFGVPPLEQSIKAMSQEQLTPLGKRLLMLEQHQLDEHLSCLFGYHLLEASAFDVDNLSRESTINHRFNLLPVATHEHNTPASLCEFDQLPLESDSIDVVLLHHILDYSPQPHQVLKEVARTVTPHGYMLIVGFNPLSWMGLWKFVAQFFSKRAFWRRQGLRLGRLIDWLHLVDFEPVTVSRGFYQPPTAHPWLLRRLGFMERLGQRWQLPGNGFYIIVARKKVCGFIPSKPKWESLSPVLGLVPGNTASRLRPPHSRR